MNTLLCPDYTVRQGKAFKMWGHFRVKQFGFGFGLSYSSIFLEVDFVR